MLSPTRLTPLGIGALCAGLLAPAAGADVLVLVSDRDGTLFENASGSLASGAGDFLFAGNNSMGNSRRTLLHFPLEQVPAGATIHSATVSLRVISTNAGDEFFGLHRVTRDWGEGASDSGNGGGGAMAEDMDATWLHALSPGCFWSTSGGDHQAVFSDGGLIGGPQATYMIGGSGLAGDVQDWIDGALPNFGWLLKHGDEIQSQTAKRFASREHGTASFRPLLTIDYTPALGPGAIHYCGPGVPTSSGCPAVIGWSGSLTAADDDLTLTADGIPAGEIGYFIAGQTQGLFTPAASQGNVCLTGAIARFSAVHQLIQGPSGSVRIDLAAIPMCLPPNCGPAAVLPGDTWSFQCWFRDGSQNNFTNGLQVTFN